MKFLERAELAKLDDKERQLYELNLKIYRDNRLVDESSLERGIAKGIEIGEARCKAEIARKLLEKGMEFPFIMETTGLSFDEVADLKASLQ